MGALKISQMLVLPTICSPHVSLTRRELRLTASIGPTFSTTRTGTTRNVTRCQAKPSIEKTSTRRMIGPANRIGTPPRPNRMRNIMPTVAMISA